MRVGRAGLQPRQLEQLVDQAREPRALRGDRRRRARALVRPRAPARRAPRPDATIAVTGERRSCDTARRTAVLISSERRSARVSTTSRGAPRARAPRQQAPPAPAGRAPRGAVLGASAGTSSVPSSSSAAGQRDRGRALVAADGLEHEPARAQLERLRDPLRRRDPAPPAGRARRAARAPARRRGRPRGRAARPPARWRAASATLEARPRRRGTPSARPSSRLGDREAAGRRDVEVVERRRAHEARGDAQPRAPDDRDEQHAEQVDDAERDRRRGTPRAGTARSVSAATSRRPRARPRRAAADGSGSASTPHRERRPARGPPAPCGSRSREVAGAPSRTPPVRLPWMTGREARFPRSRARDRGRHDDDADDTPPGASHGRPAPARPVRHHVVFLAAIALIALHGLDDNFLQPEPGTSAGDHLESGLFRSLPLGLAAGVSAPARRPSRRAGPVARGPRHRGRHRGLPLRPRVGASGDDFSSLLCFPAGLLLLGLGAVTLWRSGARTATASGATGGARCSRVAGALFAATILFSVGYGYVTDARRGAPRCRPTSSASPTRT